jgi:hypothetical protein
MSTDSGSETETKQVGEQKETSQKRNKENSDKEVSFPWEGKKNPLLKQQHHLQ